MELMEDRYFEQLELNTTYLCESEKVERQSPNYRLSWKIQDEMIKTYGQDRDYTNELIEKLEIAEKIEAMLL